jgi:hypothetical protein
MRIAGINWGILLGLKGRIAQSQGGITLIESTQIEGSPGDQAGKAKSLKTISWDHQARVPLDQMVLVMDTQEAGPQKQRPNARHSHKLRLQTIQDTPMRDGKQL